MVMQPRLETLNKLDIQLMNASDCQSLDNIFKKSFASLKAFDDFDRELRVERKYYFRMTVSRRNLEKHEVNFY